MIGRTVDQYRILSKLGEGGMGEVYLAEDTTLRCRVAIKFLPASFSPDFSRIVDVAGHKVLWMYTLDGTAPIQILEFEQPDIRIDYPRWSPDGRWVLFDRVVPQGGDIWVLNGLK